MANELKHKDIGTELTKVEFEDVTLHQLDSQAAGDLIVATSDTQLSRLAKGSDDEVLTVVSGAPAWATPSGGISFTELAGAAAPAHPETSGWADCDLSALVPAGAVAVLIRQKMAAYTKTYGVRKNGSALARYWSPANADNSGDAIILTECDANRVIETYYNDITGITSWYVLGYWS